MSFYSSAILCITLVLCLPTLINCELYIADFTQNENTGDWTEQSDTVRTEGKSKAVLVDQITKLYKRAILFTLINPQPNGAGFAGVLKPLSLNLTEYNNIKLKVRGQGQFYGYKIVLRHRGENGDQYPSFSHFFKVDGNDFEEISLPLDDFKPYRRGKPIEDQTVILDKSQITSIGVQAYGGVYLETKQAGAASLELDWIKAV